MKFLAALPVVGALLGVASASPLEPRGGQKHMTYTKWCPWEYKNHQWSCDWNNYDSHRKCCRNEKKCWYDSWECKWECCEAKDWDWDNECPRNYWPKKRDNNKKFHYYGGGGPSYHQKYDDDCKHGRKDYWSKGGSYNDWSNKNHHGGH